MQCKTVLLVENDIALRGEVARLLEAETVDVTQTDDCEVAFRHVATHAYDVIVINVTVVVLTGGMGFLQLIRDQRACIFVSPGGELWMSNAHRPQQIVLRGSFTVREFATCIADSVRKVLRTAHLGDLIPATPGNPDPRHHSTTKEKPA
jgi:CheY-like chemotaxis protein